MVKKCQLVLVLMQLQHLSGIITATSFHGNGSLIGLTLFTSLCMGDLVDDTTPQLGGNLDL